jgi:hypothetical protein
MCYNLLKNKILSKIRPFSKFSPILSSVVRSWVLFGVQSFEVESFEVGSFGVRSFEVQSFEVQSVSHLDSCISIQACELSRCIINFYYGIARS